MSMDSLITGLLYGPRGPVTRRWKDDNFGPTLEQAVAGNDDENFIEKTMIMGKYTFYGATFFSILDIVTVNNKGGLPVALSRMKYHFLPWMGAGLAYTVAANATCNIRRGKSDHWNHVAGGFAAGAVVGKCARHFVTGVLSGGFFAIIAWWYKDSTVHRYDLWPDIEHKPMGHGNPFSHKLDFTTHDKRMGERPGYWCRTPEEVEKVYKQGVLGDGNTTDRVW